MEKRKKEYFDHALDRAIGRAARILDDLRFIRQMHREGQKEQVYNYSKISEGSERKRCRIFAISQLHIFTFTLSALPIRCFAASENSEYRCQR